MNPLNDGVRSRIKSILVFYVLQFNCCRNSIPNTKLYYKYIYYFTYFNKYISIFVLPISLASCFRKYKVSYFHLVYCFRNNISIPSIKHYISNSKATFALNKSATLKLFHLNDQTVLLSKYTTLSKPAFNLA